MVKAKFVHDKSPDFNAAATPEDFVKNNPPPTKSCQESVQEKLLKQALEDLQQKYEVLKVENEHLKAEGEHGQKMKAAITLDVDDDDPKDDIVDDVGMPSDDECDLSVSLRSVPLAQSPGKTPRQVEKINLKTMEGSALGMSIPVQAIIYALGFALPIFVLVMPSPHVQGESDDAHRRLGGGASMLSIHIAYSFVGAGVMAFLMHLAKQPLLLGYILGGMLVGPIGLRLVEDSSEVATISSMGLVILLFMIGLELNVSELLKMGKVVIMTGLLQFPICAGVMSVIFISLHNAGMTLGSGPFSSLYPGLCCGISSTMIVVKLLSEKMETDTQAGRLTVGILIFQDIWAIIVLAIQPNMDNPEILGILKTFGLIAVLIVVAVLYAKYVTPAILTRASSVIELMLVLSLTWCFFVCCIAILPFANLSMELAALIAGVSMATFPYSAEFNGKLKYIRDFFITLFFVALGMQIPVPTIAVIGKALVIAIIVLAIRWLGLFLVIMVAGGGQRLAALATINLSQISEFALVICSLGKGLGHVDDETMAILIWTFSFLAVSAAYFIGFNHRLASAMEPCLNKLGCRAKVEAGGGEHDEHHEERDIVILGFGQMCSALITEFEVRNPNFLHRLHVIDVHEALGPKLRKKGIKFDYGDVTSADVLEHSHHGVCKMVLSTIPDSQLKVGSNREIIKAARSCWPEAQIITVADGKKKGDVQAHYTAGANYVLKVTKIGAERLADLICDGESAACGASRLKELMLEEAQREGAFYKSARTVIHM